MPIILPTQANIPPNDLGAYTILVHGQKKIGKTSFAAEFPDSFIMQFEPGNSRALPVKQVDIPNWKECLDIIYLLETNKTYCKTLIIDDVPSMYLYCQVFTCAKHSIMYPGDMSQGKGWSLVNTEFNIAITKLQNLSCGKIYTAHSQIRQADTRTGRSVATLETAMGAGCDRCMDAKVQIGVLLAYNKAKERIAIIQGDEYIVKAGQGIPNRFLDTQGNQLREIPMGKTAKEAYNNFVLAFNNNLENKQVVNPAKKFVLKKST